MNKISKKDMIISIILIINLAFITIPYTFKNVYIENDLKKLKSQKNNKIITQNKDFYEIYSKFNEILKELEIKPIDKKTDFSQNSLEIKLILTIDMKNLANLLTYLHKKIPDISIKTSDIDTTKQKDSEIIFYIEG